MRLAEGVYSIGQRQGGRVHAFLIDDGHELTLIDTLFDADGHRILEAIKDLGHKATDLKHIILTHGHRSHLGGLAALKKHTGATVHAHEWEADIIAGQRKAQPVTPLPKKPLHAYYLQLGLALGLGKHSPCPVDALAEEESAIGPLRVIEAPGHSPGHLGFHWPERRVLFAGDAVATWPGFSAGWRAFNLNLEQHRETMRRLATFEARAVAVGHGDPIVDGGHDRLQRLMESSNVPGIDS